MRFLLKMLGDMLQSPQPLSHIHICPKTKVKLGRTETLYPAPPSSVGIATARNPSIFGLTGRISVSAKWDCNLSVSLCNVSVKPRWAIGPTEITMQTLCFLFVTFRSYRDERIGPTEFAWPTLWLAYYQNRSHQVCVIGLTEITLCPNPNHIGPTELHVGPTENPNGHIICWIGPTEFDDSVPPRFISCV